MELGINIETRFINKLSSDLDETPEEVIKDAVSIIKWMVDEAKKGRMVVSVDNTGMVPERLSVKSIDKIIRERGIEI